MKKIFILTAIMASTLVGCDSKPSEEEIRAQRIAQINEVIKTMVSERLGDVGYEAVEFCEPDTIYTAFNEDLITIAKTHLEIAEDGLKRHPSGFFHDDYKKDFDKWSDSLALLEKAKVEFVPELVGYKVKHTFGGANGKFKQIKITSNFTVDTLLANIIDEENVDMDFGELTLFDLMGTMKLDDFMD